MKTQIHQTHMTHEVRNSCFTLKRKIYVILSYLTIIHMLFSVERDVWMMIINGEMDDERETSLCVNTTWKPTKKSRL